MNREYMIKTKDDTYFYYCDDVYVEDGCLVLEDQDGIITSFSANYWIYLKRKDY